MKVGFQGGHDLLRNDVSWCLVEFWEDVVRYWLDWNGLELKSALVVWDFFWLKGCELFYLGVDRVWVWLGHCSVLGLCLNPGGVWFRRKNLLLLVSRRLSWMSDSARKGGIWSSFLRRGIWMLLGLFWLGLGCLLIFKMELAVFEHWVNVFLYGVSLERESIGHVLEF